jgi:NADH oxidase (H2O-forming)
MTDNKILDITKDIKWIGVLDPDIRTFDIVMETKYGTTYNSYFINADKKAIVETSKYKFWDTYKDKILRTVNPEEIDYIILNHTEPDHSGSLKYLLELAKNATVVGSGNAIRYLKEIMNMDFRFRAVRDCDTLDLGNKTIRFISAPNLHWPDSMFTYIVEDKILFTCDCFGEHFCDERIFDDLVDDFDDAFHYYYKVIFKHFSRFMLKAIEKIRPLEINAICPAHGAVLRSNWKKYVDLSEQYAREAVALPSGNYVFIPYVSAYNYTKCIANEIAEGVRSANGITVDLCDIEKMTEEEMNEKLEHCNGLIIGSPTINQNVLPQIYKLFGQLNPLRDNGKLCAAFGSYGWSGEGAEIIETTLKNLKLKLFGHRMTLKFKPSDAELEKARQFGKDFAEKLLNDE